jgi:hypothetical protein
MLSSGLCIPKVEDHWHRWLRCYATSLKIVGSSPIWPLNSFNLHNPSSHTIYLGLTQPLTERVPDLSGDKVPLACKADDLTTTCESVV